MRVLINAFSSPYFWQFVASFSAALVMVSDGMQYGWSSPVIPILKSANSPVTISNKDEIWLEALFLVAGLAGLPLTPLLVDKVGCHKSILLATVCCFLAWISIGVATNVSFLYVGRFIMGVSSDLIFVVVPMYISEIADKQIRGFLTGLVYVMMLTGLLIIYSVAPFVPFYVPSIVGGLLLTVQFILFSLMPESPHYLIIQGKHSAATKSLRRFKAKDKCDAELEEISKALEMNKKGLSSIREVLFKKSTLKAFGFIAVLNFTQHFCGLSVILMNLHTILQTADSVYLESNVTGIIFVVLMLCAVIISTLLIDKIGRRVLLLSSSTLTGLSLLGLGVYFNLKNMGLDVKFISWLPIVLVMTYAVVFNIGLGIVPKVMASELFPTRIKAIGMTFGDGMYITFGTLSIVLYRYLVENHGLQMPFYVFGVISFAATLFTFFVIPETKGKSWEEIQSILEK